MKNEQWVDVNVCLPQKEGLYLVCFDDGYMPTTALFEDGGFTTWADAGDVIAWQHLPEPFERQTFTGKDLLNNVIDELNRARGQLLSLVDVEVANSEDIDLINDIDSDLEKLTENYDILSVNLENLEMIV